LLALATNTLTEWKEQLSNKLKEIIKVYPPKLSVDPGELADSFLVTLEGAYVMTRVMHEPEIIQIHLEQYKTYLEFLFRPH
ncbi:MAG: TetR/AcrR family transcriptional regulator, partial [Gammaproteobacteria bacterium]